jgi:hypothetical protein
MHPNRKQHTTYTYNRYRCNSCENRDDQLLTHVLHTGLPGLGTTAIIKQTATNGKPVLS